MGNFILISDLETLVKADKSKSSARNYLSMLNSLRIFLGGDNSLSINNITPAFVQSFGDSMLQR
ncbi:MAG: phage integrase SAM-like domain-containing protein, partial [Duncaniella sp.]|nr:phage integrase SAM-like domain-containing protein [Duncaniella sp.]